jgi:hypothetical protein
LGAQQEGDDDELDTVVEGCCCDKSRKSENPVFQAVSVDSVQSEVRSIGLTRTASTQKATEAPFLIASTKRSAKAGSAKSLKETTFVRSLGHTIHFMSTNAMYDGIR